MTEVDFPFGFDARGGTASTSCADHVRDMIELLLLTAPGERVNRPDFGTGLLQLVFEPNSPELAAAVELTSRGALERWLGDVVEVDRLEARADESSLVVVLDYTLPATGEMRTETFRRPGPG